MTSEIRQKAKTRDGAPTQIQRSELPPIELPAFPAIGFTATSADVADGLLRRWEHYLGPCSRPFGRQDWLLWLDDRPLAIAVSASAVSDTVAGYKRQEVVELARLCADPQASWATRVALRLWREVAGPRWPFWPVKAAIAYSQNVRHPGNIYRFDGWEKITDRAGSSGGGTWSRRHYAGDAAHGRKTLWLWRYV